MKFAHGINSSPSPSSYSLSSHDRPVLQEVLSAEAIAENLDEGKAMHDCMFELEYLTEQKHSVDKELQTIHARQHEISIEHGSHGKS